MEWIHNHWKDILALIGGVVTVASLVVKLTPSKKDDVLLTQIIRILSALSLFNADGSMIGGRE